MPNPNSTDSTAATLDAQGLHALFTALPLAQQVTLFRGLLAAQAPTAAAQAGLLADLLAEWPGCPLPPVVTAVQAALAAEARLTWTYRGIAAHGDAHGEIHVSTAVVGGRTITRHRHGNGRTVYTVAGTLYRRQRKAIAAAQTAAGGTVPR